MPDWKEEIKQRLSGLNLEPTREADIVEEISQHLEDRYAELLGSGDTPEEAFRTALADLSDSRMLSRELRRVEQRVAPEHVHPGVPGTSKSMSMIGDVWQDLRYGARLLRKNKGFTLVATVSLALGIGANTTIFSLLDALLLRPLPVKAPGELVVVNLAPPGEPGRAHSSFSYPVFREIREKNTAFSGHVRTLGIADEP